MALGKVKKIREKSKPKVNPLMTFDSLMMVADCMEIGKDYASPTLESETGLSGYYVKFMLSIMENNKICEKSSEVFAGKQVYMTRRKSIDNSVNGKILLAISGGFNDIRSLTSFTKLDIDILQNGLDELVAEQVLCTYVENKKSKPFYKKIPLLAFIYPVTIPTNLIQKRTFSEGKMKVEQYPKQRGMFA